MRFLRDLFLKNFTLKLAAIISSIAIWIYADGKTSSTSVVEARVINSSTTIPMTHLYKIKIRATHDVINNLRNGFELQTSDRDFLITNATIKETTGHNCVVLSVKKLSLAKQNITE